LIFFQSKGYFLCCERLNLKNHFSSPPARKTSFFWRCLAVFGGIKRFRVRRPKALSREKPNRKKKRVALEVEREQFWLILTGNEPGKGVKIVDSL
jgi:hypothetical protein